MMVICILLNMDSERSEFPVWLRSLAAAELTFTRAPSWELGDPHGSCGISLFLKGVGGGGDGPLLKGELRPSEYPSESLWLQG